MDNLYFYYLDFLQQYSIPDFIITVSWYLISFCMIAALLILVVLILVLLERKVLAFFTLRKGPNRVGFEGMLQTVADAIKLLFKENITPANCNKFLFFIAPIIAFVPVMTVWALIPFNSDFKVINSSVGILLYFAIAALPVLGIIFAGYASKNNYSLLGAMRAIVQILSYELPIMNVVLAVVVLSGTMNLGDIVNAQTATSGLFSWYFIPCFLGFCIFYICALAELNRTPFDLSEAESELVAGYNTEYSGMRFALFFLGEYSALFVMCALISTIFLGGYLSPFGFYFTDKIVEIFKLSQVIGSVLLYIEQTCWLFAKIFILIFSIMWVRATMPRFRVDTLINAAWKWLLPLSFLNLLIVCIYRILCV